MNHFGRVLEGKMASCGVGFRGDEVCNCFGEDFLGFFSGELEHHLFFRGKITHLKRLETLKRF